MKTAAGFLVTTAMICLGIVPLISLGTKALTMSAGEIVVTGVLATLVLVLLGSNVQLCNTVGKLLTTAIARRQNPLG